MASVTPMSIPSQGGAVRWRPEILEAQRGQGPLSEIVRPEPNEDVIEVPQASSFLLSPWDVDCVLGLPADAIKRHLSPRYGFPRWKRFNPQADPGWGYGLLVIRDGLLRRGPALWDTSG